MVLHLIVISSVVLAPCGSGRDLLAVLQVTSLISICTERAQRASSTTTCIIIYIYVIVVPWVSRVYGICTLRAVICIPEGAARGNTYNYAKSTNHTP